MIWNIEKLAEAQRKIENLKSELKRDDSNLVSSRFRAKRMSKSIAVEIDEDDNEDDDMLRRDDDETNLRKRSIRAAGGDVTQLGNIINGAQNITQRLLEKTRERKLKQRQFRKEHDLKLAFSEFYLSLILLQNYQTLNYTGFRKILKKHDKVS